MITALIPARGGSKRVPGKNLARIGDLPLVDFSIIAAKTAYNIDHVVVSSDDQKILERCGHYENVVAWRRDPASASDAATDRDVIMEYYYRLFTAGPPDLIVYLRPTTPLRFVSDIEQAIEKLKAVPDATGLRSVHEMSESAHKCLQIAPGDRLTCLSPEYLMASVEIDGANKPNHFYPKTYQPNGVVDIVRPSVFLSGATFGNRCMAYVTKPVIEIDTPFDLEMVRYQYSYNTGEQFRRYDAK